MRGRGANVGGGLWREILSSVADLKRRDTPVSVVIRGGGLQLHGRTFFRAIGTEDTAVSGLGTHQNATVNTFVEEPAGIDRHVFEPYVPAMRAGKQRL